MSVGYKRSGVDVALAERLVEHLKARVPGIGGFSGLVPLDPRGRTFLAATTDGVGTKLKLAFMLERHDTIGIDLVAMCANDLAAVGATPWFFLDYYATGRLEWGRSKAVLEGILEGCRRARMALLGGETAEMPGFYGNGEYDLAGFAVGRVSKEELPSTRSLRAGDIILGLPSSGVHSNGFSLVRKALGPRELRRLGPELLTPTRIYVRELRRLARALGRARHRWLGLAHITGGGLVRNLGRVLGDGPGGLDAELRPGWAAPPVFERLRAAGVGEAESFRTFNMGIGFAVVLSPPAVPAARRALPELVEIGRMTRGGGRVLGV